MSLTRALWSPSRRDLAAQSVNLTVAAAGIGAGLAGLMVNGTGTLDAVAGLAGGWLLIATGLLQWARSAAPHDAAEKGRRRPAFHPGPLLAATGLGSLVAGWNTPAIGFGPAFGAGLILYAAAPPLLGHAAPAL